MKKNILILPLMGALALVSCETGDVVTGRAVVMRHTPPPAPAPRYVAKPAPTPAPAVRQAVPTPPPPAATKPAPAPAARPVAPSRPAATMNTRPVVRQTPAARPQQNAVCPTTGKKVYPVMPGQNRGLKLR